MVCLDVWHEIFLNEARLWSNDSERIAIQKRIEGFLKSQRLYGICRESADLGHLILHIKGRGFVGTNEILEIMPYDKVSNIAFVWVFS